MKLVHIIIVYLTVHTQLYCFLPLEQNLSSQKWFKIIEHNSPIGLRILRKLHMGEHEHLIDSVNAVVESSWKFLRLLLMPNFWSHCANTATCPSPIYGFLWLLRFQVRFPCWCTTVSTELLQMFFLSQVCVIQAGLYLLLSLLLPALLPLLLPLLLPQQLWSGSAMEVRNWIHIIGDTHN